MISVMKFRAFQHSWTFHHSCSSKVRGKCSLTLRRSPCSHSHLRIQPMPHWHGCITTGELGRIGPLNILLATSNSPQLSLLEVIISLHSSGRNGRWKMQRLLHPFLATFCLPSACHLDMGVGKGGDCFTLSRPLLASPHLVCWKLYPWYQKCRHTQ